MDALAVSITTNFLLNEQNIIFLIMHSQRFINIKKKNKMTSIYNKFNLMELNERLWNIIGFWVFCGRDKRYSEKNHITPFVLIFSITFLSQITRSYGLLESFHCVSSVIFSFPFFYFYSCFNLSSRHITFHKPLYFTPIFPNVDFKRHSSNDAN